MTNLQEVITPMEEKDRFKKFQEAEKKRYRAEQQRFEMKHSKQLEEARAGSQAAVKELEQVFLSFTVTDNNVKNVPQCS